MPTAERNICHAGAQPSLRAGELAVVVGAATSGAAAVKLLVHLGARVRLLERNEANISEELRETAKKHGVEIQAGEHSAEQFRGAAVVVTSPGVPVHVLRPLLEAVGSPPLVGEMELALRFVRDPIIAVSGTSGKTTTVSLAAAMLEESGKTVFLGGNIGTPLSEYVLRPQKADVLVLELSSFQLQSCESLHPKVAVLLNLTENHLDHHADMAEYAEAKFRIFACQDEADTAILPPELLPQYSARGCRGKAVLFAASGRFAAMKLAGRHNAANAEAAYLACREFGVTEEEAARAVAAFTPLRHRLEVAGEHNGVLYVNDSKCTTVEAMRAALTSFTAPVILLAGGKFKGGDLASLVPLLTERVRCVALFGASRAVFEAAWQGAVPMTWDVDLDAAMARVVPLAVRGDVVLLSPATSSYDLYKNYMERGDHFCRIVKELA